MVEGENAEVSRLGLEPRTYGLTCRTGFHPPDCCRCGLDFTISLGGATGGEPLVKSLRIPAAAGLSC
jgi:hypothetical protein